jgi:hypothetical protein
MLHNAPLLALGAVVLAAVFAFSSCASDPDAVTGSADQAQVRPSPRPRPEPKPDPPPVTPKPHPAPIDTGDPPPPGAPMP